MKIESSNETIGDTARTHAMLRAFSRKGICVQSLTKCTSFCYWQYHDCGFEKLGQLLNIVMSTKVKSKVLKKDVAKKKAGAKGYKMPEPIPLGEILKDIGKRSWKIGPSIGVGGFGEIYSASEDLVSSSNKRSTYPYVIKIEPHENGPLFVEMHFYMRVAKPSYIEDWMSQRKMKSLGLPCYISSGSHECSGTKYRFVVMDRFGQDLWSIFVKNKRKFPTHTVFRVGLQVLDALEYIHSKGYVHGDIKGGNLLLGLTKAMENQVYLVDFGLASHFTTEPQFKPDPKTAHNGTIEYTSRDAHQGVPTMRGDLEILAYNLLQWLCSTLPWEALLTNPVAVQEHKNQAMDDIPGFMKKCFPNTAAPVAILGFLKAVASLRFNETPDYDKFRSLLFNGVITSGGSIEGKLDFSCKQGLEELEPEPVLFRTTRRKVQPRVEARSSAEDRVLNVAPHVNNGVRKSPRKGVQESVSWQDCPTMIHSSVTVPGVYKRANKAPPSTNKRTKKV